MKNYFWPVLIIFVISFWLRFDCYQTKHPDQDELFELSSLLSKDITTVFDNKAFYGDHTSFPGEYLLYALPLRMLGKTPSIDVGRMEVTGMERHDFLKMALVKMVLWVVSFWLLYAICVSMMGGWGVVLALAIYGFNFQLVYHAFELRPYSVLPVLVILNFWLATRRGGWRLDVCYGLVILFTCVYHAYGVMIAFLPLFFMNSSRRWWILSVVPFALAAWVYYAVYSHFGLSPNTAQSQVDTFQYFPKVKFFENLLLNLSGGSLIFYMIVPLLAFSFIRGIGSDDLMFLILLIIVPLALICLVDIKTHYWFHPRQFIWVIPFFAVFCGRQVSKTGGRPC
ncbi:MAG: hypothetical protein AAB815_00875 [Patescibacteria group bacterium]